MTRIVRRAKPAHPPNKNLLYLWLGYVVLSKTWLFVAPLATLATNIGPLLVPRRGVVMAWRA
uniref:Uncharacterized protein n=1 Tax=Podoviridae sp. ct53O25 TaxID=2826539 RepID=A0A8S5MBI9_9CAUD|nr:MAG TPA: hypothetical protein [Podoviridae sp. ct53O25]